MKVKDLFNHVAFKRRKIKSMTIQEASRLIVKGDLIKPKNAKKVKELLEEKVVRNTKEFQRTRRDTQKMETLFYALAKREGTVCLNVTLEEDMMDISPSKEYMLSRNALSSYLSTLEEIGITQNQEAYVRRLRKKANIRKAVKRHLMEPAIACAILNLSEKDVLKKPELTERLFESLCEKKLREQVKELNGKVYYYGETTSSISVDAIIEIPGKRYGAFEIILDLKEEEIAVKKLKKFYDMVEIKPEFMCILYGVGTEVRQREDGIYVIPIREIES